MCKMTRERERRCRQPDTWTTRSPNIRKFKCERTDANEIKIVRLLASAFRVQCMLGECVRNSYNESNEYCVSCWTHSNESKIENRKRLTQNEIYSIRFKASIDARHSCVVAGIFFLLVSHALLLCLFRAVLWLLVVFRRIWWTENKVSSSLFVRTDMQSKRMQKPSSSCARDTRYMQME